MATSTIKTIAALSLLAVLFLGLCLPHTSSLSSCEATATVRFSNQDPRPNLLVDPAAIYILNEDVNVTDGVFGKDYQIHATILNAGESRADNVSITIGIRNVNSGSNYSIYDDSYDSLDSNNTNNTIDVDVNWTLTTTVVGTYEIWVCADLMNVVDESNESDNFATFDFLVWSLQTDVDIMTDKAQYEGGERIYITALVTYAGTNDGVGGAQVSFFLTDENAVLVPYTQTTYVMTDSSGHVVISIGIPTYIETGVYQVGATVFDDPKIGLESVHIAKESAEPPQEPVDIPAIVVVAITAPAAFILLVYWLRLSKRLR